jgi:hypothetical protein
MPWITEKFWPGPLRKLTGCPVKLTVPRIAGVGVMVAVGVDVAGGSVSVGEGVTVGMSVLVGSRVAVKRTVMLTMGDRVFVATKITCVGGAGGLKPHPTSISTKNAVISKPTARKLYKPILLQ